MQLLKNYCRNANIKTAITVGVVGFPNVGKSSLINSLKRSKVCDVGAVAGVTRTAQHIVLDKNIHLIDSPGIVFGRAKEDGSNTQELMLRNAVRVESIEDPTAPGKLRKRSEAICVCVCVCDARFLNFSVTLNRSLQSNSCSHSAVQTISPESTRFRHSQT